MPLDEIDLFKQHLPLLGKDLQDSTALPLFLSGDDHDQIVLLDVIFWNGHFKFPFILSPACPWGRTCRMPLEDLRGQRDDLHKPFGPKLPGDRTENSGPNRIPLRIDEDSRIIIKFDV